MIPLLSGAVDAAPESLRFRVRLDASVAETPITGRLFVFLSQKESGQPRFGPDWFHPEPFFAADVRDFQPGATRFIDEESDGFPGKLSTLPPGEYRVQALLHHDFYSPYPGRGVGNFFSDVAKFDLDPAASGTVQLVLDQVVEPKSAPLPDWAREIAIRSPLLSDFHGREVIDRATVILPPSYESRPERRYPVVYIIPGFGGSHLGRQWLALTGPREAEPGEVEFIRVMLSGQCRWGHHVYANSAANGPRGDALVEELVPHVDENFRTVPAPTARFLTGHSSGGWSSLWLQVTYPDHFGGVWSSAPDSVDFRDFQQVNIYADPPLSLYVDEQGNPRPIARRGTEPILWYEPFCRMDDCLGYGGQMRSFEAVFSPTGPDGQPLKLWDRTSGRVNPQVARAWRRYDINLLLQKNWTTLAPKLQGKLHITTGGLDTFYLNGAVELLARTLRELGSDAQIEILPGKDHGGILAPDHIQTVRREMCETFLRHHPRVELPSP
jgi:S-formylglutathione hydrolase FrmB